MGRPAVYFSYGSCGYMLSPEWLGSLPDVPQRQEASPVYDAELAATPADGDPAAPVGLGAFVFESYTPGNGNTFRAVRNEDYWRGPNGITGEDLPYLDAIEAVVVVDVESRSNALRSGEIDAMHTANADYVNQFLDDDEFELTSGSRFGETNYILLNNAADPALDPEGKNASSPLLNVHCRKALAHAIDNERLAEERGAGLIAAGQRPVPARFARLPRGHRLPGLRPRRGQSSRWTCASPSSAPTASSSRSTRRTTRSTSRRNTLIISMWKEVFGDQVQATITPIEQGQYIGLALTGAFQAQGWRQHGGSDPDQQRLWWHERATPARSAAWR